MARPRINYDPNTIRENLKVLASFDQADHLTGKGAKKLHIHNNGRFSVDEGRGSAFKRTITAGVSLIEKHNRDSIENLFKEAISLLVFNGPFESGLRVDIFKALRGFRYLIVNGYGGRMEALDRTFSRCRSHFDHVLEEAIIGAANFTTVYSGEVMPHVTFRNVGYGQATYIDKEYLGDGICFGIAAKWGVRNVLHNKQSIMSSRHDQNPQSDLALKRLEYSSDLEKSVEILLKTPHLLDSLNQKIFGNSPPLNFMSRFATRDQAKDYLIRYFETREDKNPDRQRLKNKGDEMYAIMHQQEDILNNGKRIGDVIRYYNKPQNQFQPTTQNLLKFNPLKPDPNDQQYKQQQYNYIEAMAGIFDKCRVVKVDCITLGSKRDNTLGKFYMMDFTAFSTDLKWMMDQCNIDKNRIVNERVLAGKTDQVAFSYLFSWKAEKIDGYGNINDRDGHALGLSFNPSLGHSACLIFDPNYGEFRCNDIKTAGEHFAKLFSLYSSKSNIAVAFLHRISISGIHHSFESNP